MESEMLRRLSPKNVLSMNEEKTLMSVPSRAVMGPPEYPRPALPETRHGEPSADKLQFTFWVSVREGLDIG